MAVMRRCLHRARGGPAGSWFLAGVCVVLASCASAAGAGSASSSATLQEREAEFFMAMAARDADRLTALFADDAVLHVAGMPAVDGRAAIRQFYGNVFRFLASSRAVPERIEESAAGDIGWTAGGVVNVFESGQGTTEYPGRYVIVWRRAARDWHVVLYAVGSDQPDPRR